MIAIWLFSEGSELSFGDRNSTSEYLHPKIAVSPCLFTQDIIAVPQPDCPKLNHYTET